MPESAIIQSVLREVENLDLPATAKGLDLSCGEGELLQKLTDLGLTMEGTHYRDDDYILRQPEPILKQATIHNPVDLTQPLPFADASYDLVLATEVIEHLPAHAPIIMEIGRILKPGGTLIFSTPNPHRTLSRLQFLVTGTHALNGARLGWHVPAEELYSTHYNPVYFPVIHSLLYQSGLQVQKLGFTSCRLSGYLLTALLWPLAFIPTAVECHHFRKRSEAGGRDLFKWLKAPNLFLSKQLVVVAEKISNH
jgi:SAM-dependent methyltransferase